MGQIWEDQNKYQRWLDVELAVVETLAEEGVIPKQDAKEIKARASFSVDRINEIEAEIRHDVIAFTTAVAERVGMHSTDLECLGFLRDEGPVPAGRLAELTGLTTGAVTRMIDRLERAGYVRREADPRDRRRVIVRAIPGRANEIGPLFGGMRRAMDELCARYTDAELTLILDFVSRAGAVGLEQVAKLRAGGAEPAERGSSRPG